MYTLELFRIHYGIFFLTESEIEMKLKFRIREQKKILIIENRFIVF